jgi:hypothetical protein
MKIRWMQNSLRLRITPSELAALQKGIPLREELRLPQEPDPVWGMQVVAHLGETCVQSRGSVVEVLLNRVDVERLSSPNREGIYFHNEGLDTSFTYYVEKDFPCVHPRAVEIEEAATETFAPPQDFVQRKL